MRTAGVQVFVYGRNAWDAPESAPRRFPARQTAEASQAIARLHRLDPARTLFLQQAPQAIDQGVFHNDVIAVGNRNYLMFHEQAFVDSDRMLQRLRATIAEQCGWPLITTCFSAEELPLADAVNSYLFNSQLLSRPAGGMTLLCPQETRNIESSYVCTQRILDEDNPVDRVEFLDLRQSMNNGGGPACLRLRVVMSMEQLQHMHPGVRFDHSLYEQLTAWVNRHYREELAADDLRDPHLIQEVDAAFCELQSILDLPGAVFGFQ